MAKKRQPCPAGIEDSCPIPRYRCREVGEPGKHCFELFAEFERFVLPEEDPEQDEDVRDLPIIDERPRAVNPDFAENDAVLQAVLRQFKASGTS